MGNNPVSMMDPDGRELLGGRFHEIQMFKQMEQIVADWRKQLMESFSMEEAMRQFEIEKLWGDVTTGRFASGGGVDNGGEGGTGPWPSQIEVQDHLNLTVLIMRQFYISQINNTQGPVEPFYPVDFNFNGNIGEPDIVGKRLKRYNVTITLDSEFVDATFIFTPHEIPEANYLRGFIEMGYRTRDTFIGNPGYLIELHNTITQHAQYTVGFLQFINSNDYNKFLKYVKYPINRE